MVKVFTPAQARTAAEQRSIKDAERARNILETTTLIIKEREDADREFLRSMQEKREYSERFFAEQVAKKREIEREVLALEERRRKALIPLTEKEKDIQLREAAVAAREAELADEAEDNEQTSRLLMERLDDVADREQELNQREKRLKALEQGAEIQRNQIAQDAKRLSLQIDEFRRKAEETETDFAYRASKLDAQQNLYNDNDKLLAKREQEIEVAKRVLADQRILLDKGFQELNKLKQKHGRSN